MKYYDTVVLGGGPGGYHAALILKERGRDVAIIEKNKVGGTCLHSGCIPTKSLLHSAKWSVGKPDAEKIFAKKRTDVNKLFNGLSTRLQKKGIPVIQGAGKLCEKDGSIIVQVENEEVSFSNLILATGSQNVRVDIPGLNECLESGKAVYSDEFLELASLPGKVALIGGGVIGLEFASFLSMLGIDVTVIENRHDILNCALDDDCMSIYKTKLEESGINIVTGAFIEEIDEGNIVYRVLDEYKEEEFELVVVACGRKANVNGIGLENVGINIENGFVCVDERCRTNKSNIYACGDLIGKTMLAHAAYKEAEIIADSITNREKIICEYVVPNVIYTNPEVAFVGKSEEYCKSHNIDYFVKKGSMLFSGRYLIEHGSFPGICKLIFAADETLIGAQMVGNSSSEIIFSLSDMIESKLKIAEITDKCFPHPSFVEIIKEIANS